jgi:hypothetical protein
MGNPKDKKIDHINGQVLDNRKTNLRVVTSQQNNFNRRKSKGSSVYKGVHLCKKTNKWRASIQFNKKKYCLGYHDNEKDAALAYNNKCIVFFGEYGILNIV